MSLGPVAYKREKVPSHRVRGTDYLIHFLKLYIDDEAESAKAKSKSPGMPRLSLTPKADAAGAMKTIMATSRPKKVGRRRKVSTRRTTAKLPSSRRHGIKRRKRKKSKSSGKKQKTSYMPVVVLSPPEPSKNEVRDCRDCYDRRLDHDGSRGRSPPSRRRTPARRGQYSPTPSGYSRRRSPMQRSPPPRRRPSRTRESPYRSPYRSPERRPSRERHDYPDRFAYKIERRRGEAGASGNTFERAPAWALPPRDDVFSPREGHLGDKLDLLTRMLRDMKTEMKDVKSRQRKRRFRPRNPNQAMQPTIITIPGQQPPPPSAQPPAAPAVIHSGGPNVVPYPIYIPTPGGGGGYGGGGGGGGAPRQSGSWSNWFGGGSNNPPPPPPNYHQDHSHSEPDYTYFEEGGLRGMLGLEAFNDETVLWIVLIGIAGMIAVQELERQRMEWGPRDSSGWRKFGTSWDEMLYGPYATANVTEGTLSFLLALISNFYVG